MIRHRVMNVVCACWVFADEKAGEYGCLQRVHVLLQYMEHLERLLYNAYEGCAVAMAAPPKVHTSFPFKLFDECGIVHCLSDHSFVLKEGCSLAMAAPPKVHTSFPFKLFDECGIVHCLFDHSFVLKEGYAVPKAAPPKVRTSFSLKLFDECGIVHCLSDHSFVLKEGCSLAMAAPPKVHTSFSFNSLLSVGLYTVYQTIVLFSRKTVLWPRLQPTR